jgi:hypothetical protein
VTGVQTCALPIYPQSLQRVIGLDRGLPSTTIKDI